jgi:hypothetical protein
LHFVNSGSIPDTSKAREAQLVEQNIEAIWVVSSSLISSIIKNRCAGIGIQVSLRMKWFKYLASSTLVIYIVYNDLEIFTIKLRDNIKYSD